MSTNLREQTLKISWISAADKNNVTSETPDRKITFSFFSLDLSFQFLMN